MTTCGGLLMYSTELPQEYRRANIHISGLNSRRNYPDVPNGNPCKSTERQRSCSCAQP
jgi:hypothetical protein